MVEIWKEIVNTNYEASTFGKIRNKMTMVSESARPKEVHPPTQILDCLMQFHPVNYLLLGRYAHDPKAPFGKLTYNIIAYLRKVIGANMFYELPCSNNIKFHIKLFIGIRINGL